MILQGVHIKVSFQRVPGQSPSEIRYLVFGNGVPLGMVWRRQLGHGRPWWRADSEQVHPGVIWPFRSCYDRRLDAVRPMISRLLDQKPQVKQTVAQAGTAALAA